MNKKILIPIFLAGIALPLSLPKQGFTGVDAYFIGEYGDKTSYIKNIGDPLNSQLADEGFVLLKNDGTLPIAKASKLSVVGKSSTNLSRGGAGSGSGSITSGVTGVDLQKSLTDAGFEINEELTHFYKNENGYNSGSGRTNGNTSWRGISQVTIGETPMSSYSEELLATLDDYNDAIIQVITREGSEGCDVKTVDCRDNNSAPETTKHALELSDNEAALFAEIKEHTEHVIIIINSSNIFECDVFEKDPKVAGILWIGNPGDVGPGAVGRILCGDVNPSGHTVDTWARDFTKDPTFQNFSDNQQHNPSVTGEGYASCDTMYNANGKPTMSFGTYKQYNDYDNIPYGADESLTHIPADFSIANEVMPGGVNGVKPASYVSYEEGIYMDYRYYETRYADMAAADKAAADAWYAGEEGVVYPFGFGLSYTTFKQEIVRVSPHKENTLTSNDEVIEVSVKVTNTGKVAGKEVVQLYWRAPYIKNGIEKADRVLCAFGKTEILEPGKSQNVHLKFYLQDVANYDYTDANKNNFKGYELDPGEYEVLVCKNAHEILDSVSYNVGDSGIQYKYDRFTGHEVKNRFTDRGFQDVLPQADDIPFEHLSRTDFAATFPHNPAVNKAARTLGENSRVEEFLTHKFHIGEVDVDHNFEIVPEEAYRSEEDYLREGWVQPNDTLPASERMQLSEMIGAEFDDPRWEQLVNEMTWAEMMKFVETNNMRSPALNEIGKPSFSEGDGPQKFSIMWWVSSPIIAATFNQELAHQQGEAIGMESHIQNKSGWWGCGVNTHRSPFGGRNFEYYSADPFLMGRMAANVIGAATDRGIYCYFKHFAVNDQEKNRESGICYLSEQALREIYLKSFQMVFEEGKSMGVMTSYNRIGLMETAASYPLLTEVVRGEWGFKGAMLSDMTHSNNAYIDHACYEDLNTRIIAGDNSQLDQNGGFPGSLTAKWDKTALNGKGAPVFEYKGQKYVSYTTWNAVRTAIKEIMYMSSKCTAMNRGLTPVAADPVVTVQAGKYVCIDTEQVEELVAGEEIDGKVVKGVDYFELNRRVDLPEGVGFEDGAIYGVFKNLGVYRFDIIAHLSVETVTNAGEENETRTPGDLTVAIKLVVNVEPDMSVTGYEDIPDEPDVPDQPDQPDVPDTPDIPDQSASEPSEPASVPSEPAKPAGNGCGGSIVATSSLIALMSLVGVGAMLLKRRKEN